MIVIGIDPGTARTGYGIVRRQGSRIVRIGSGEIKTKTDQTIEQKLLVIHNSLEEILTRYGPTAAAVEDVFFAKNARSALKLGHVRGVILLTLARRDLPVASYPPAFIKRAIVGAGRAAKDQVRKVVQAILSLPSLPGEDEADALAVAICHANAPQKGRS